MAVGIRRRRDTRSSRSARSIVAFAGFLLVLIWVNCPAPVFAAGASQSEPLSSAYIIEQARSLDGRPIVYEGEIIGDMMRRGEYAWINVSDNNSALGVWTRIESLASVVLVGNYRQRGDQVRIVGTFNRACMEHGGDYDIHAVQVIQIAPGFMADHPLNPFLAFTAMVTFSLAMAVLILFQRQRTARVRLLSHSMKGDSPRRLP